MTTTVVTVLAAHAPGYPHAFGYPHAPGYPHAFGYLHAFSYAHALATVLALPLACAGHVLVDLPIFMGPVVVLAGWLLIMTRRARRSERLGERSSEGLDERETLPTSDPEIRDNLFGVCA